MIKRVPQPFAPLMRAAAECRVGFTLVPREPFASRTARNIGKYERNAIQPDLPKVEQIGLARNAYFPRDIMGKFMTHQNGTGRPPPTIEIDSS